MADTQIRDLPKRLPAVPEAVLKKRKRREVHRVSQVQLSIKKRSEQYKKRKQTFKRAEQFVKEYRKKEQDNIRLKRQARIRGNFFTTNDSRLAFVIRIRSVNHASQNVRKALHLFHLNMINTGVFIKLNEATVNMLRICEPYVTWGYPNIKSVRDLIHKRGFARIDKKRFPITSNAIIEESIGSSGFICIEDLIHEIFTCGEKFKTACNFLWPFKLNTPNGGWRKITNHFKNGGDYGNREDKINELIKSMI